MANDKFNPAWIVRSCMYCNLPSFEEVWASAQSDQSLRCPHEESLNPYYPLSAQRRFWSDWADAQADLSLRWAQMSVCWFCHKAAHMTILMFVVNLSKFLDHAYMRPGHIKYFHDSLYGYRYRWMSNRTGYMFPGVRQYTGQLRMPMLPGIQDGTAWLYWWTSLSHYFLFIPFFECRETSRFLQLTIIKCKRCHNQRPQPSSGNT